MSEAFVSSLAIAFTVLNVQGIAYWLVLITAAIKELFNVWEESGCQARLCSLSLFIVSDKNEGTA